jgi:hypothetical protein
MYSFPLRMVFATAFPALCLAQTWEIGAVGGYGWYHNPTITNPTITSPLESGQAGFPPRAAIGVVFGENLYKYVGGEVRWLFRFGGPELQSNGIRESASGYTNSITYDFLFHMTSRESKARPFVAAGAGVKVYTGSARDFFQPLAGLAILRPVTQTQPNISVGGGLKYLLHQHIQLRLEFRMLVAPLPDEVIQPIRPFTRIHGWVYDFVPLGGISYVFRTHIDP